MRGYADGCLLMLALTQTNVTVLDDVLGVYRIHGANLNVNRTDTGKAAIDVLAAQRIFVNKQLYLRGRRSIPFDDHAWYRHQLDILRGRGDLKEEDSIAIYGTAAAGLYISEILSELGIKIWGYVDSDPNKWGKMFVCGMRIHAPSELPVLRHFFSKIIIGSSAVEAILYTLYNLGFTDEDIIALPL
jgi:hypothetical protein